MTEHRPIKPPQEDKSSSLLERASGAIGLKDLGAAPMPQTFDDVPMKRAYGTDAYWIDRYATGKVADDETSEWLLGAAQLAPLRDPRAAPTWGIPTAAGIV